MDRLKALWQAEAPAFPLWAPVFIGFGVWCWFALPFEPPFWALAAFVLGYASLALLLWDRATRAPFATIAIGLVVFGLCLAGARARIVAAPVLPTTVEATVEGVVREVTRTAAGRPRLLLDELVIYGLAEVETPLRAQVSLLREAHLAGISPGIRVSIFAHLGPPGGPVEPGAFDFRRDAWFKSLGAVGYARGAPALIPPEGEPGVFRRLRIELAGFRARIGDGLRTALPGETGSFAAAVTVGDRAGISREATQALRDSNLAHLLAISGLHVGLVTALVFAASRLVLAAIPRTARLWRTKSVAALIALSAATGYLLLSGAAVATQRAYLMALVALVAVLLNRPAITLRALAVAATAILVITPEALGHVGFQMSFAATAAIIAGFDFARERGWSLSPGRGEGARKVGVYLVALLGTSFLAGLATGPFSAFHFHRVANFGLIANLAAVPVMGFWVAPSALLAAALAPFGLETWALWSMGKGIDAIMLVARFVAGLEGATRGVAAAPGLVLGLVSVGGLGLCLGRGILRPLGAVMASLGIALWLVGDARPTLLISPGARLVGIVGPEGRALDQRRAQSYAAGQWLEADGDEALQAEAAARPGLLIDEDARIAALPNGWRVAVLADKARGRPPAPEILNRLCAPRTLIVSASPLAPLDGGCDILSGEALAQMGALAIEPAGEELLIVSAAERAGRRFWTRSTAPASGEAAMQAPGE